MAWMPAYIAVSNLLSTISMIDILYLQEITKPRHLYVPSVLLHGQIQNGAKGIYWQASVINHDITSSGRKGVERERGE
jgi:hypothetical protein